MRILLVGLVWIGWGSLSRLWMIMILLSNLIVKSRRIRKRGQLSHIVDNKRKTTTKTIKKTFINQTKISLSHYNWTQVICFLQMLKLFIFTIKTQAQVFTRWAQSATAIKMNAPCKILVSQTQHKLQRSRTLQSKLTTTTILDGKQGRNKIFIQLFSTIIKLSNVTPATLRLILTVVLPMIVLVM